MAKGSLSQAVGKIVETMDQIQADELGTKLFQIVQANPILKRELDGLYGSDNAFFSGKFKGNLESLKGTSRSLWLRLAHDFPTVLLGALFSEKSQKDKVKELVHIGESMVQIVDVMFQIEVGSYFSLHEIKKHLTSNIHLMSKPYKKRAEAVIEKIEKMDDRQQKMTRPNPRTVVDTTAIKTHEVISRTPKTKKKKRA